MSRSAERVEDEGDQAKEISTEMEGGRITPSRRGSGVRRRILAVSTEH